MILVEDKPPQTKTRRNDDVIEKMDSRQVVLVKSLKVHQKETSGKTMEN